MQSVKKVQNDSQRILDEIIFEAKKFNWRKLSIPLFSTDWALNIQSMNQKYVKKITDIITEQDSRKNDSFSHVAVKKIPSSPSFQGGIHLVLEGVSDASFYFGGLFKIIDNIFINTPNLAQQPMTSAIKMITCSNFHSMFGFLLSLG